ncbi:MAG: UPF0104 family protein [Chloroflexi bacterium]|nr:MAG: UPF0104 family protein [Chloroflexota bacterium]
MTTDVKRRMALGAALAVLVLIGLLLYGDIREMSRLVQEFDWRLMPAIFGLTVLNYALRSVRFHYYLREVGVRNISLWTSIRVFIGGFSLTLTPGKVGELIRLLWLKNIANANPATAAPSIVVDRVIDGLAMALLAALGLLAYPQYWPAVGFIMTVLLVGVVVVQIRPLALWLLALGERLPLVSKIAHHLHALYESTYQLLRPKNFLVGLGVGLLAWIAEGLAFYWVLVGLGVPEAMQVALLSIFTLAVGSLIGGASSLPGGLGATEASMTGILQVVLGLSEAMAATATLIIRFFTLWSGVGLGVLIVLIWRKMLFGYGNNQPNVADQPSSGVDLNLQKKVGR